MALIVEDGTVVSAANTYVSVAEARDFATARGVTLSAVDGEVEVLLIKAMDYLQAYEDRFIGQRVQSDQPLAWPRYGVVLYGYTQDFSVIPTELKNAQCQLSIEAVTRTLLPSSDGREVIRKKLDVLETQWTPTGGAPLPIFPLAESFLRPLTGGRGGSLTVRRA